MIYEINKLIPTFTYFAKNNLTRIELSIPDLLSKIIKFTTITPSLKSTGKIIIRNVIRNYMRAIGNNLFSERLPLCQNTLKLLVVMNSHDPAISKELLESFTYNLNLKVMFDFIIYHIFSYVEMVY